MAELEKVIRGLGCLSNPYVQDMDERDCENCKYDNACCFLDVTADALTLLKAQGSRIMAADELKEYLMINDSGLLSHDQWRELSQRAPLYMEFREPDEYQVNWRTVERLRPWAMESMFWEKYKINRRCWTSRPTDEQREKVNWDAAD